MMRGLTLNQPYALLAALERKRWETRSWSTTYRGPIAIHASKETPGWCQELLRVEPFRSACRGFELVRGAILAIATLADCIRCGPLEHEKIVRPEWDFGDFAEGRYRFGFVDVHRLAKPMPYRGMLGLWTIPPEIEVRLRLAAGL